MLSKSDYSRVAPDRIRKVANKIRERVDSVYDGD